MDISPLPSPPSIQVHESQADQGARRSFSRTSSDQSTNSQTSRGPMSIPSSRANDAPPPLPPPRYIEDIAYGHDPGWAWGNIGDEINFGKATLAPIRHGSSMHGGYLRPTTDPNGDEYDEEMDIGISDRRGSSVSTLRSASELTQGEDMLQLHQTFARSPTPGHLQSHQLQGELPLAQRTLEHSSNAYDKHLLRRIGKSNSPSGSRAGSRSDIYMGPASRGTSFSGSPSQRLMSIEVPQPFRDPIAQQTPASSTSGISPNLRYGWRDYAESPASGIDVSASPSVDHGHFPRQREHSYPSASGSVVGLYDDTFSMSSRSNQGSYDQSVINEADIEHSYEETRAFRHLHIDDGVSAQPERRRSRQGQKRRRRSVSRDRAQDVVFPSTLNTSLDVMQRGLVVGSYAKSPSLQQPHQGSVSSTSSSGLRQGSYASSAGLSAGGTSITTMSSFDRLSPGALSPHSDVDHSQASPYVASMPLNQKSAPLPTRPMKQPSAVDAKLSGPSVKPASQSISRAKTSSKMGGSFVCSCCPKKPRHYETAEELNIHETEKQYSCSFCHNRFKNKNEAERHQNSLHLRHHSWSCAAIAGPEAAFHPTVSATFQSARPQKTDACGYCGEEFSNAPRPDWDQRREHLAVLHKFGECNKSKKFFRADHFRQHLKHSHAGVAGKWTNMLENACMKDEPAGDEVDSPSEDRSRTDVSPGTTSTDTLTIESAEPDEP